MQVNEGLAPFSFQWLFSKFALRIILASNQEFIIKLKSITKVAKI